MGKVKDITTNEIMLAQNGNIDAINKIVKAYKPVAFYIAKLYYAPGNDANDLVQEGLIGVHQAIQIYKESRGSWNALVNACMKRRMYDLIRKATTEKNNVLANHYHSTMCCREQTETRFFFLTLSQIILAPKKMW